MPFWFPTRTKSCNKSRIWQRSCRKTSRKPANELRLCAYFRIGMSIKQIAQILNVSPESIRIHRYRLKKKLMLGEEENIDDFIRNV